MQIPQYRNYAASNFYVNYAYQNQSVCPPNEQFINNIANADNKQLVRIAARIANTGKGRENIIPAIINSPFSSWLKNPNALENRQHNFKAILQTIKTLRGYYLEQYAFYNKQVGDVKAKSVLCQYVSSAIESNRRQTTKNNETYMQQNIIYMQGPGGVFSFCLADVAPTAADKKSEIWTDMLLIQRMADERKMEQVLLTETALPEFHSNPAKGRCSYKGASSRQALKWIQDKVHRVIYKRAKAAGINLMGFAVPEPHKDGCPHLHVALFLLPNHLPHLIKIVNDVKAEISAEYCINYSLDLKLKADLKEGQEAAKAASYAMKYVIKSFDDPTVGAWYSRDCGGEIRRCNRIGLQGFKSKFNFLYKMRNQLLKHSINLIRELGEMLCSNIKLSEKKYIFFNDFNSFFKSVYLKDEKGNNRFSHVTHTHENEEVILFNINRILDLNNKADKDLIDNYNSEIDNKAHQGADACSAYSTAAFVDLQRFANLGSVVIKDLTVNVCYSRRKSKNSNRIIFNFQPIKLGSYQSTHLEQQKYLVSN